MDGQCWLSWPRFSSFYLVLQGRRNASASRKRPANICSASPNTGGATLSRSASANPLARQVRGLPFVRQTNWECGAGDVWCYPMNNGCSAAWQFNRSIVASRAGRRWQLHGAGTSRDSGGTNEAAARQAAGLGKSARRHFQRNQELLPQNLTGMHGLELLGHCRVLLLLFSGSPRFRRRPLCQTGFRPLR